mmetsp:Transcript_692/g.1748  ORF Transcript_692/g.1748 Transcript_692/m.1748 type:complete len:143 (-) Transcript_692:2144-2572(-)|eukprot:1161593-Pelagomonas_calceolata.AAC.19
MVPLLSTECELAPGAFCSARFGALETQRLENHPLQHAAVCTTQQQAKTACGAEFGVTHKSGIPQQTPKSACGAGPCHSSKSAFTQQTPEIGLSCSISRSAHSLGSAEPVVQDIAARTGLLSRSKYQNLPVMQLLLACTLSRC